MQGSKGAEFHAQLVINKTYVSKWLLLVLTRYRDKIVQKGTDPRVDSYSAFCDNNHNSLTGLYDILDSAGITDVYVCGMFVAHVLVTEHYSVSVC